MLTGLCESGKTLIFSQLLHNEARETFTSTAENVGEYNIEGSAATLRVIDIPGNERLRGRFFDQYKVTAKGIMFVIDSVTVQKDIRDVAEYDIPFSVFFFAYFDECFILSFTVICTLFWLMQVLVRYHF